METNQVFDHYLRQGRSARTSVRYCPRCGAAPKVVPFGKCNHFSCQECGFTLYKNPSPGVVTLIADNDKILLGKRSQTVFKGGKWSLPGGFIEFDEDFLSAAHREIKEETNLSVEIISLLSVVSNFLAPELHTLVIVLLAKQISGPLRPGDDMVELEWVPFSGPLPPMAFEADEHIIRRYHWTHLPGAPIDPRFASLLKE